MTPHVTGRLSPGGGPGRAGRPGRACPRLVKAGPTVTHVEWTKPFADLLDGDDGYYELKVRVRVPDAPFIQLKFDVEQTCEDSTSHAQVVVDWNAAAGATTGEPART